MNESFLSKKCAIIIPTKNQSHFINDKLDYFSQIHFSGSIYISDSSDIEEFNTTHSLIQVYSSNGLKVYHIEAKGLNIEEAKLLAVQKVKEGYCIYCGDDDFIMLSGLVKGIKYLDKNPFFCSCTGEGLKIDFSENKTNSFDLYQLHGASERNLINRFLKYSKDYWPIWVIHRTNNFRQLLEETVLYKTAHFREIFMGLKCISQGRCKKLNAPYLIRGMHSKRFVFPNMIELSKTANFIDDKKRLELFITEVLLEDLILSKEHARNYNNKILNPFINITQQSNTPYYYQYFPGILVKKAISLYKIIFSRYQFYLYNYHFINNQDFTNFILKRANL